MLSTANMKSSQYIAMHGKQIRGLAFSSRSKGLLLSASLDNTVKLTRWVLQGGGWGLVRLALNSVEINIRVRMALAPCVCGGGALSSEIQFIEFKMYCFSK